MGNRVFVSYSHQQGAWVWDCIVPCLRAGGAEILIDRERFQAGQAVAGQMDSTQDSADQNLLVLSPDYLNSPYCTHEMNRAIDKDPTFQHSVVIPVIREDCTLPSQLTPPSPPLYVDLQDDKDTAQWHSLLTVCGADLGVPAPEWIRARNDIRRFLQRNESVNWSGYTLLDKWMQENPVTM